MSTIRIAIADDQSLFVESLTRVLETRTTEIEVVGTASNGEEAVRCVEEQKPQIVLMDVRMPVMNGIEATRLIHERRPEIKIMMLTTFDDDLFVYESIKNGAVGYVLKSIPLEELIACIRALSVGTIQISPQIAKKIARQAMGQGDSSGKDLSETERSRELLKGLSRREKEVLELALKAYDNREIAERLFISEQTVKNHLSTLYSKFGVSNRLHLIRLIERSREIR